MFKTKTYKRAYQVTTNDLSSIIERIVKVNKHTLEKIEIERINYLGLLWRVITTCRFEAYKNPLKTTDKLKRL